MTELTMFILAIIGGFVSGVFIAGCFIYADQVMKRLAKGPNTRQST